MFCSVIIQSTKLIYEITYKTVTYVPGTFVTDLPGLYTSQGGGLGGGDFHRAWVTKPP